MNRILSVLFLFLWVLPMLSAQNHEVIELRKPDLSLGLNLMEALSQRASVTVFDTRELSLQDLSDLLWAANGVNRQNEGKRTAPSAQNAQDIEIYVFFAAGIYQYHADKHVLQSVAMGDHRMLIAGRQENFAKAPVMLLLVSDISRFRSGDHAQRMNWAAMDAGIVSQNIALFCAARGMVTRPRASMNQTALRELLNLSDHQHLMLNLPVSYPPKAE